MTSPGIGFITWRNSGLAPKEFETTDKYRRKMTVVWGKPSIYISNDDPRLHKDMTDDMRHWLQETLSTKLLMINFIN